MECDVTQPELVPFHFADVDDEARARVEAHLRQCGPCLDDYLALKRSIEAADLRPSDDAHARLRSAVAQELSAAEPAPWQWWERPLVVAFATIAVALTTLTVGQLCRPFVIAANPPRQRRRGAYVGSVGVAPECENKSGALHSHSPTTAAETKKARSSGPGLRSGGGGSRTRVRK